MNVNPFSKKSAAVAKPVKGVSPLNDIGDVSAVTEMFQRLRQQNAQYDQAIAALVAANRIKDGWDKPAEPEMSLTIQRDVLVGLGDTEALAKFDQEHQQELAQEQAARAQAAQRLVEAPARVKALEQYINDLAGQIEADVDETFLHDEAIRMFTPSARRMLDAAKLFVQAWREMLAMESVLTHAIRLRHYSVFGDRLRSFDVELIGRTDPGDLLPNLIEGISYDELSDLNHAFRKYDEATSQQVKERLQMAGVPNGWHTVYHPGANDDARPIYAPDPNPPSKRPEAIPFAGATVVRIDN